MKFVVELSLCSGDPTLGRGDRTAELLGHLGHGESFDASEDQRHTSVWREPAHDAIDGSQLSQHIRRRSRGDECEQLLVIGCFGARHQPEPSQQAATPQPIAYHVNGDCPEPAGKGIGIALSRQAFEGMDEHVLDHIVEIGLIGDQTTHESRHLLNVAVEQLLLGRNVSRSSTNDELAGWHFRRWARDAPIERDDFSLHRSPLCRV